MHDFVIPELGKAVPYGIYDIADNAGWVNLGISHDAAVFSIESIRRWWYDFGAARYPHRDAAADHRGLRRQQRRASAPVEAGTASAGRRTRISITVCHLPPGTSKWNKIEHRLFAFITQNWRGEPLVCRHASSSL